MKIISVGGGPSGLYFSLLFKKAFPDAEIDVYERNEPQDTFGWGVVFSKETLGNLEAADPESYADISKRFAYWDDIETWVGDTCVVSRGHGFCGLARKELLDILQRRCAALGVKLHFQKEVKRLSELPPADLILAADGIHSPLRTELADHFRPSLDMRKCKFTWLGTTLPLRAFTFFFKQTPHGLFQVHAYPFNADTSTFIVECREEVWKKAGLENATEKDTVAFCEKLFQDELGGHRLLANKSIWRTFPTVTNERWYHRNVVLLGDAAHTAHFSIGSGTKLAMEDAIALKEAFVACGTREVEKALAHYEAMRRLDVLKTQKAAQTSLEWFENSARYLEQPPLQFTFNLLTRSKRITYDNLRTRDLQLVSQMDEWFSKAHGTPRGTSGEAPPPLFAPFKLRELKLENRMVVSPMCMYSADDGTVNDWHLVHLGSRAVGGAGLVLTEMTDVSAEGRITPGCAGLYKPEHVAAWKRIVDFVHQHSAAKIGVQLAHAGRKGSCQRPWEGDAPLSTGGWLTLGPSALPFAKNWPVPREMTKEDMTKVVSQFVQGTLWAEEAGFDLLELHAAHGYLLSSFLSPLSNVRQDAYGGSLENRLRFPLEVFDAVRKAWPAHKPISVRISASDWLPDEGQSIEESVEIARQFKAHGADIIDVSSGGNSPKSKPQYGRMYQVPFADQIRHEAKVPVMTVGAIQGADHANTVLAAGRADLVALARPHLANPYLTYHHADARGYDALAWPPQYAVVAPSPKKAAVL